MPSRWPSDDTAPIKCPKCGQSDGVAMECERTTVLWYRHDGKGYNDEAGDDDGDVEPTGTFNCESCDFSFTEDQAKDAEEKREKDTIEEAGYGP